MTAKGNKCYRYRIIVGNKVSREVLYCQQYQKPLSIGR